MNFQADWFSHNIPLWEQVLAEHRGKRVNYLEIGCFEGRATVWLISNILTNPASRIVCVDTFEGSEEFPALQIDMTVAQANFYSNIREAVKDGGYPGNFPPVFLLVGAAHKVIPRAMRFDMVYVDGSHQAADVLLDACFAWPLLNPGGLMIFDDYEWQPPVNYPAHKRPKRAIDSFLSCFVERFDMVHIGYQVIIRKD